MPEADIMRSIYIKEEPMLAPLGYFHEGIELVAVLEGEVEAFHINHSEKLKVGEIFFADSLNSRLNFTISLKNISPTA